MELSRTGLQQSLSAWAVLHCLPAVGLLDAYGLAFSHALHSHLSVTNRHMSDDVNANKSLFSNERETPSTRAALRRHPPCDPSCHLLRAFILAAFSAGVAALPAPAVVPHIPIHYPEIAQISDLFMIIQCFTCYST
jgi:hypothetical protein